jgi:hypothetical protein
MCIEVQRRKVHHTEVLYQSEIGCKINLILLSRIFACRKVHMNKINFVYILLSLLAGSRLAVADWLPEKEAPYEIVSSNDLVIVEKSGLHTSEREIVYRILNEQGRNYLALKGIPFVPDAQKIQLLKASTVTEGKETFVNIKTATVQQAKGPSGGLTHSKELVIPFTNLEVGSLVKYKYRER